MTVFSKRTDWSGGQNRLSFLTERLQKEGRDLIDLTLTNPTSCGFRSQNQTLLESFKSAENLAYQPDPRGLFCAREAVSRYYADKKIKVSPERIFITSSTSEAYAFCLKLLLNTDDRAAVPAPSYPLLESLAVLNDARLFRYCLEHKERWRIEREAFGDKTEFKALCVINPNNPTGNFVRSEEKVILNTLCQERGSSLISDEVFLDFVIDQNAEPLSFADNDEVLTFTLSGISKILGLPQMKLSWIVVSGPERQVNEALRRLEIMADATLSASTPSQNALNTWMQRRSEIQSEISERICQNYRLLKEIFKDRKELTVLGVEGGWQAVIRTDVGMDDETLALKFLEKAGVWIHPGYLYDFKEGEYFVVSLLPSSPNLREGLRRITGFLDNPNVES